MSVIRDDVLRITQSPVKESKDYKCQDPRVLADIRGGKAGHAPVQMTLPFLDISLGPCIQFSTILI